MRVRRVAFSSGAFVLAVLGLGTTGCAEQSAAARVGDETVSESDLLDEVEVLADLSSEQTEGDLGGSYSQAFVGQVLQQRIAALLVDRILVEEDAQVTEEDRTAARQRIEGSDPSFAEAPDWYQDLVVEDVSKFDKLAQIQPEDGGLSALLQMADEVDVEIGSRFGSWDPSLLEEYYTSQGQAPPAVVPPAGPQSAPNGDGDGGATGVPDPSAVEGGTSGQTVPE